MSASPWPLAPKNQLTLTKRMPISWTPPLHFTQLARQSGGCCVQGFTVDAAGGIENKWDLKRPVILLYKQLPRRCYSLTFIGYLLCGGPCVQFRVYVISVPTTPPWGRDKYHKPYFIDHWDWENHVASGKAVLWPWVRVGAPLPHQPALLATTRRLRWVFLLSDFDKPFSLLFGS